MEYPLISQFSPNSCALDCWAHFITERGHPICTEEILRHHRDICFNKDIGTYGAIGPVRFKLLVRRYLKKADDFSPSTIDEVEKKLSDHDIFVFATAYNGNKHVLRVIGCSVQGIELLIPGFPYGTQENATFEKVTKDWGATFIAVQFSSEGNLV